MEVAWCTPVNTVPSVWGGGGGMGVASKACPWGLDVGQTEQVYISGIAVSLADNIHVYLEAFEVA